MNKYAEHSQVDKGALYRRIHKPGAFICVKKRGFDTPAEARRFLASNGYGGRPYQCRHCHRWHNTTKVCA